MPFETLERRETTLLGQSSYEGRAPQLLVVARPEEVPTLDNWITEEAKNRLRTLDYASSFALAVFQGYKVETGYGVQIERILARPDKVTVLAKFMEPHPEKSRGAMVTSPYQLVRVTRLGEWGRVKTIELVVEGKVIMSISRMFQ